jgi:hypothetical protein
MHKRVKDVIGARLSGDVSVKVPPVPFFAAVEIKVEVMDFLDCRQTDFRMLGEHVEQRRRASLLGSNDDKVRQRPRSPVFHVQGSEMTVNKLSCAADNWRAPNGLFRGFHSRRQLSQRYTPHNVFHILRRLSRNS